MEYFVEIWRDNLLVSCVQAKTRDEAGKLCKSIKLKPGERLWLCTREPVLGSAFVGKKFATFSNY